MGKIWIWTKIVAFALILTYIIIFCSINHAHDADVWVFYNRVIQGTVLSVAACSFIAGVLATVFIRTTVVTLRQFREMKERNRAEKLNRDVAELKSKAAMLQPRPISEAGDSNSKT
jgi:uncharacterized integral membrane protein